MLYRLLGSTGLRVSQLALGTGNFGTGWGYGSEKPAAQIVYDAFRDAGGNFIDTADQYQFGESETMLGEFVAPHRDEVVLATKFGIGPAVDAGLQSTGNSRRAMVQSVEASLRRLKTDRIDLLWVHFPDQMTPIDEIARGLDDLVRAGKILYSGLSNFPAWRVSASVTIAELRGWAPIAAIQTEYSLVERSADRDLFPMATAYGLGILGWSPLGGGLLTGKYRRGETGRAEGLKAVIHAEDEIRKTRALDQLITISAETGASPGQIAIAWVLSKGVLPILGPRTVEQLTDNLAAGEIDLSAQQLMALEEASAIELGSPHAFAGREGIVNRLAGGVANRLVLPEKLAVR